MGLLLIHIETELIATDRKRLVFKVKAYDNVGCIGAGIHERFIVDNHRIIEKANKKYTDVDVNR